MKVDINFLREFGKNSFKQQKISFFKDKMSRKEILNEKKSFRAKAINTLRSNILTESYYKLEMELFKIDQCD